MSIQQHGRGVAEAQALFDETLRQAEPRGDGLDRLAGLEELQEGNDLVGRMHGHRPTFSARKKLRCSTPSRIVWQGTGWSGPIAPPAASSWRALSWASAWGSGGLSRTFSGASVSLESGISGIRRGRRRVHAGHSRIDLTLEAALRRHLDDICVDNCLCRLRQCHLGIDAVAGEATNFDNEDMEGRSWPGD